MIRIALFVVVTLFLYSCSVRVYFSPATYFKCNEPGIVNQVHKQVQVKLFHDKLRFFKLDTFIPVQRQRQFAVCMARIYERKATFGFVKYYVIKTDDNKYFVKVFKKIYHETH